ncbi:hypothetical protein HBI81_141260 [Parastagonospora nodorum]|nr:hypothetical protein HBI81_141260 [Parastagonospora nodorum]
MATTDTIQRAIALTQEGPVIEANDTNPAQSAVLDHPEGDSIRRQVEFYFSDENLPTDLHLLQCCGGRDNNPVSVSRIVGFKKMRSYKPKALVVTALRQSSLLEVSTDGKTIKRKIPLQGKCALDEDFFEEDNDVAYDPRTRKPAVFPVEPLPQKKAEYPPGTSKNMMKPTGFEANYIEPPVKPDEAAEEEAMYSPDKPFVERIELAIQRFKEKRRMHQDYAQVFDKLMQMGGVDSSQRIAQGLSRQEIAQMGAEERAIARATHRVPWDRADEDHWLVDFASIIRAFLSSWFPVHFGYSPNAVKNACQVPRSFYNYLRYHKVCPEYDQQLEEALKICDLAEKELPKVYAAGLALPGDFNKSASTIFGGAHAGMYTGTQSWANEIRSEGIEFEDTGIRQEEAKIKFATGVAILGSEEQYNKVEVEDIKVMEKVSASLEVIDIQLPTEATKDHFQKQSEVVRQKLGQLEPIGKLLCKTWIDNDCDEWDLPRDKYHIGKPQRASAGQDYGFWVEESVLNECFIGMKIDATVMILDIGITIMDEVHESLCSFFAFLPNELWMERKPKAWHWHKKGLAEDDEGDIAGEEVAEDEFDDE